MNSQAKVKGIAFLLTTLLIIASVVLPPTPALAYVFARSYFHRTTTQYTLLQLETV